MSVKQLMGELKREAESKAELLYGNAERSLKKGKFYDAIKDLEESAELGHGESQYLIGGYHHSNRDYEEAFEMFVESAERGNAKAQFALYKALMYGIGCDRDVDKAVEMLKEADIGGVGAAGPELKRLGLPVPPKVQVK